jgi:glycosyltransferase involved in cell wall biosynthesis
MSEPRLRSSAGAADELCAESPSGEPPVAGGGSPTFSVLVAAYNAESTLRITVESVLSQSDPDWEAVIVDDGSADETMRIAQRFAEMDPRISVARQRNRGPGAARNEASRAARGRYLCFLDADDRYMPTFLEDMRRFIEQWPGRAIYSCNPYNADSQEELAPYNPHVYPREGVALGLSDMVEMNRIFIAAAVDARAFRDVGGFGAERYCADYELWLRILRSGGLHMHNPAHLVVYSVAGDRMSSQLEPTAAALRALAADRSTSRALRRQAALRIRRYDRQLARICGARLRRELETRLAIGDYRSARSRVWECRSGFNSTVGFMGGLALGLLSPRLLGRVLRRRRDVGGPQDPWAGS